MTGTKATSKRPKQIGLFSGGPIDQNLLCARIIVSEAERYGGPGSLMCRWAEAVLARA
jgi:hypothetical protein